MKIKRFNEIEDNNLNENIDPDLLGITTKSGRRTGTRNPNSK